MLINYLPPVLKNIREFQLIMADEDVENEKIYSSIANLQNNQYITTVTENSIERYEKMLNIVPQDTETLEDRRFRVFTEYNKKLPYTMIGLENDLKTLCGEDEYSVGIDYDKDTLTVKVALNVKNMFHTVKEYLNSVVPLNMIIDLVLLYNMWGMVGSKYTWNQVSNYSWKQLREDVI